MRKIKILFTLLILCSMAYSQDKVCDASLNDDIVKNMGNEIKFLKDFNVQLPKAIDCNNLPEAKYSMVLLKNNIYRFAIKSSHLYNSEAKLTLFDTGNDSAKDRIFGTVSNKPGTNPAYFDFIVEKTGTYKLKVSFANGEEGCATVMLFYVRTVE